MGAQHAVQQDFYVDNLLSECHDEEQCYELYQILSTELNKAGLPLRKWCSSSAYVMSKMSNAESQSTYMLAISAKATMSTLGLV